MYTKAKTRLSIIGHYKKCGKVSVTCRRFGISRTTFYKWLSRFLEKGPRGLEDLPRTPKRRRASRIPWQTVQLVCDLRREHPAWSRHKIAVILKNFFSHPYRPKDNASVERKIQTDKYEVWAFREGYTVGELNEVPNEWNHAYNYVRPHQSLGYLTPMEFLNSWMEECKDRVSPSTCSEPGHGLDRGSYNLLFIYRPRKVKM